MNLRELEYIVAVADLRSFSKAAEHCCVSQPTLSGQVKKLEEYLGVKLFERTNKRVIPTDAGLSIIGSARRALHEIANIQETADAAHDPLAGKFRIGAFPTLSSYLFPAIVPTITRTMPNLKLILLEEKTEALLDKLRQGLVDAAFLALPISDDFLVSRKLFDDPFLLAVSPSHPLAIYSQISGEMLFRQRLLLLEEGHCLRNQSLDVCELHGASEDPDFRGTSLETIRQMVKANTGITLMPEIATQNSSGGIKYIPFARDHAPHRSIGLVWRKTCARTQVIDNILKVFEDGAKQTAVSA